MSTVQYAMGFIITKSSSVFTVIYLATRILLEAMPGDAESDQWCN